MDTVFDQEDLIAALLELLAACPASLQKELVSAIPDIVTDGDHSTLVLALQELMADDTTLTVNVLDALSNLDIDDTLTVRVRSPRPAHNLMLLFAGNSSGFGPVVA